jgi:hypothetical protein
MNLTAKAIGNDFVKLCKNINNPIVFELGTKQSVVGRSTFHKFYAPHASAYYGIDVEDGIDVDLVADVHNLSDIINNQNKIPKKCDIFISCSTFEHIRNPFKAMEEISKIMNPTSLLFIQTHQSFPLHAYPYDYWRYTIESLSYIVECAGFKILDAAYEFPCSIVSKESPGTKDAPAFLNVCCIAEKMV